MLELLLPAASTSGSAHGHMGCTCLVGELTCLVLIQGPPARNDFPMQRFDNNRPHGAPFPNQPPARQIFNGPPGVPFPNGPPVGQIPNRAPVGPIPNRPLVGPVVNRPPGAIDAAAGAAAAPAAAPVKSARGCVLVENVPQGATVADVVTFFEGYNVLKGGIYVVNPNELRRPTWTLVAQFKSTDAAEDAAVCLSSVAPPPGEGGGVGVSLQLSINNLSGHLSRLSSPSTSLSSYSLCLQFICPSTC
jgi:hypothetical protein